uniref:Ankyrin-2 n=1 Tax=Cajanus cajan TaxID=3821 RepID=A0A151TWS4_CAJCA|nr:Ankyrin-2 [Cajanus cajan]
MDRLVKAEAKEVEVMFSKGQKCSSTFKLTNLMHTMSVAVSLTTTNPSLFSINKPFSIIPPLSSSSYTLHLTHPSDHPPLSDPPDAVTVRTTMLPTGKAPADHLRRLFSKPGPHLFRDAVLTISFVGPHVAQFLISQTSQSRNHFTKGISSLHVVKLLEASGCGINDTVLHEAAATNRIDAMEFLVERYGDELDLDSVDGEGRTAIHVAAGEGHVRVIQFCVSMGGNPNLVDWKGWSPLHYAAWGGHVEAVECLLECSNVKGVRDREGRRASCVAAEREESEARRRLLDLLRDQNGWSPLHWAAFKGRIKSVKVLLEHGAEVDTVDDAGYTPLHCAAEAGHLQVALFLLAHGASQANLKSFPRLAANFHSSKITSLHFLSN